MATRSIIKVKGNNATIYKHWDGYPEVMIPWLTQASKLFVSRRSNLEVDYFLAYLIKTIHHSDFRGAEKFGLDESLFTGWGIMTGKVDVGQEYEYHIDLKKEVIICLNVCSKQKTSYSFSSENVEFLSKSSF